MPRFCWLFEKTGAAGHGRGGARLGWRGACAGKNIGRGPRGGEGVTRAGGAVASPSSIFSIWKDVWERMRGAPSPSSIFSISIDEPLRWCPRTGTLIDRSCLRQSRPDKNTDNETARNMSRRKTGMEDPSGSRRGGGTSSTMGPGRGRLEPRRGGAVSTRTICAASAGPA